ncbi:MAG: hypothetical protein ACTSVI_15820 [Promethearchaeota archaeon]
MNSIKKIKRKGVPLEKQGFLDKMRNKEYSIVRIEESQYNMKPFGKGQKLICPVCGFIIPPGLNFCLNCSYTIKEDGQKIH